MENFPSAFILASCDEVYKDNNVLYRLVKPAHDSNGVESTDRLVNVVPFRRKYQFKARCDIDEFAHEILSRPLVLQPVLHFGRGLGSCGVCYVEEPWVVMINQTHPKILSRLQMGLDAGRAAFQRGHSAELRFCFGTAIQRLYCDHLRNKETEEAKGRLESFFAKCRYAEWEHADLIIRYHGYSADERLKTPTVEMEWHFEDIVAEEMTWSQVGNQIFPRPHLMPVSEDEIRQVLPKWTINGVSPLQAIGEEVPQSNYSYAKAGTLYESFRKKKRQREPPSVHSSLHNNTVLREAATACLSEEQMGAVGGGPRHFDAIEHDFTRGNEKDKEQLSRSSSRRAYIVNEGKQSNYETDQLYDDSGRYYGQQSPMNESERNSLPMCSYEDGLYENERRSRNAHDSNRHHHHDSRAPMRGLEVNGHFDADVKILTPAAMAMEYDRSDAALSPPNNQHSLRLKKQDSDRSTGSTNADSGYCEDGRRSRGDSYDYNDNIGSSKPRYARHVDQPHYNSQVDTVIEKGLDNPAFSRSDEVDDALTRHKRIVANTMSKTTQNKVMPSVISNGRVNDTAEQIAESFI